VVDAPPAFRLCLTCVVPPKPRAPTNKRKALDLTDDGADLDDDLWCQRCVRALGRSPEEAIKLGCSKDRLKGHKLCKRCRSGRKECVTVPPSFRAHVRRLMGAIETVDEPGGNTMESIQDMASEIGRRMGTAGAVVAENVAPVSGTSSSGPAGGVGGGGGAGGFSGLPTEGTQLLILDALRTLAALYAQTSGIALAPWPERREVSLETILTPFYAPPNPDADSTTGAPDTPGTGTPDT